MDQIGAGGFESRVLRATKEPDVAVLTKISEILSQLGVGDDAIRLPSAKENQDLRRQLVESNAANHEMLREVLEKAAPQYTRPPPPRSSLNNWTQSEFGFKSSSTEPNSLPGPASPVCVHVCVL